MGSFFKRRPIHVIGGAVLGLLALITMLLVREWLRVAPPVDNPSRPVAQEGLPATMVSEHSTTLNGTYSNCLAEAWMTLVDIKSRIRQGWKPLSSTYKPFTLVSEERLENVAASVTYAVINGLRGDYVEAGVWRGGCSLFAAHAIKLFSRCGAPYQPHVWMADSFEGFPEPRQEDMLLKSEEKAAPMDKPGTKNAGGVDKVRDLFEQYGMLEPGSPPLHFLAGWFKDTLPSAPVEAISVLRADGDLYSSTTDIFNALFHRVIPCGVVIIDDYGHFPQCKKAVVDFFTDLDYAPRLCVVDYTAVWFQNTHGVLEGTCPILSPSVCTRWIDFGSDNKEVLPDTDKKGQ